MAYPPISLDGAIVVLTGGARGIGKSTAELFATKGATVFVGDLDGGDFTVDVTSRDSFADFVASALDRHGRIDVLVNNAGVMPLGDFLSEDDAVSRTTFDVNVWGRWPGAVPAYRQRNCRRSACARRCKINDNDCWRTTGGVRFRRHRRGGHRRRPF